MKKTIQITVSIIVLILSSFYCGFYMGFSKKLPCPPGVLSLPTMQHLWNNDVKASFLKEIQDENLQLDDDFSKIFMKENYESYSPLVFVHPFIILKKESEWGYRIFLSSNQNCFDNFASPLIDLSRTKDVGKNTETSPTTQIQFSGLSKLNTNTNERLQPEVYTLVTYREDENLDQTTICLKSTCKDFIEILYKDTNADGVIDAIICVTQKGEKQSFKPIEFFNSVRLSNKCEDEN